MDIMFWAFGAVAVLALGIIAVAGYVVFWRDRGVANSRVRAKRRPGKEPRSSPRRGVPKSR